MTIDQASILLNFVQTQDGQVWANGRTGWNKGDLSGKYEVFFLSFKTCSYRRSLLKNIIYLMYEVCFWDGVLCDPNDQSTVTGIFIPGGGYSGTLPSELGALLTLKELAMPQNQIRGRIPKEIASLPHLESINLAENEITGTIPPFTSPSLSSVDLSHNLLAGTLDPNIGRTHKALTDFDVVHNKLSGPIPESFASAEGLDTLSLSENRFSGTLPSTLGDAKQLRYLYLDNNFFMGTIPPQIARQNSPLEELWLQENLLSGTIPAALADLKALFNFYIDGNKFTGTVPEQLCREEINADFFEGVEDGMDRNYCDSIACEPGYVSFEGVFPCSECSESFFNPYLGRVGSCIDMKEEDILDDIYDTSKGADWTGGVNWQVAGIPKCSMTGITCDDNENIIGINLKGKGLRGNIPESIGFLQFLERLDLSDNQLTGFVPSDLRWAPLEFLDITGNQLRGIVPLELCKKDGINGNGQNGNFGCDMIACSAGYFSETGDGIGDSKCMPCKEGSSFLGSKICYKSMGFTSKIPNISGKEISRGGAFFIFVFVIATIVGAIIAVKKVRKHLSSRMEQVSQNDDQDDEYGDLNLAHSIS